MYTECGIIHPYTNHLLYYLGIHLPNWVSEKLKRTNSSRCAILYLRIFIIFSLNIINEYCICCGSIPIRESWSFISNSSKVCWINNWSLTCLISRSTTKDTNNSYYTIFDNNTMLLQFQLLKLVIHFHRLLDRFQLEERFLHQDHR